MGDVLYLTSDDVVDLADMADYVEAVRDGFRQRGEGADAASPTRTANDAGGVSLVSYAAALPDSGVIGAYTFSMGADTADGWYTAALFDAGNGTLLAIVDGGCWNPYKAGAAGGVAVDALARETVDTVGVIGSGSQARAQLTAVDVVRDFESVAVYSPTAAHRTAFAADMDDALGADVSAVETAATAIKGSQVVIVATEATSTVFDGESLEPGTHVNAVGLETLDTTSIERSKYVVDHRDRGLSGDSSLAEWIADGVLSDGDLYGELGDVVAGSVPGRETRDDITIFDSQGTGIETVAAAHMLYRRAVDQGRGSTVASTPASEGFRMSSFTKAFQLDE